MIPMGKQSRLKQERKHRREEQRPQVEAWSQIPADARRGPCPNPDCAVARCLDPWVTVVELTNSSYEGPLVILCWSKPRDDVQIQKLLRINGEDIAEIPTPTLPPEVYDAQQNDLTRAVTSRYGAGALLAVARHLAAGAAVREVNRPNPQA